MPSSDSQTQHPTGNFHELPVALCTLLEKCVNSALRYDPGTSAKLNTLNGKTLAIVAEQPAFSLRMYAEGKQLRFTHLSDTQAQATISGKLSALISLLFSDSANLASTGVRVEGELSLLSAYQQLLQNLDIDWQDALANLIGNIPAHQVAIIIGALASSAPEPGASAQAIAAFITEELKAVPAKAQVQQFSQQVSQLRQATDKLELRLKKINKTTQTQQQQ